MLTNLCTLSPLGFGRLENSGDARTTHNLTDTFDSCKNSLGNTLGEPWMRCVVDTLLEKQAAAKRDGIEYFAVEPHSYDPFQTISGHSYDSQSDNLKNKMRDYSCDVADGGSQPLRTTTWQYLEPDPCEDAQDVNQGFKYKPQRFLPAGNDLQLTRSPQVSVEEAETICAADSRCKGFTFSAPGWSDCPEDRRTMQTISFKSKSDDAAQGEGWHTFKRSRAPDCDRPSRPPRKEFNLTVHVLRESPPVYLVDDFYSTDECSYMLNYTLPLMDRSVVVGGGTSNWRQSYSVNMYPDFDDETHVITKVARRKFAFARTMAGYTGLFENEGQEPVNAVYYKNYGDHYGAHCDGDCTGGNYLDGRRIATSVTYCLVADKGGYTLFTRSGLKVVPKPRQMLFFGYLLDPKSRAVDRGHTEHSGCPIRKGRKWITTMWYRQGVTAEKDWTKFTF